MHLLWSCELHVCWYVNNVRYSIWGHLLSSLRLSFLVRCILIFCSNFFTSFFVLFFNSLDFADINIAEIMRCWILFLVAGIKFSSRMCPTFVVLLVIYISDCLMSCCLTEVQPLLCFYIYVFILFHSFTFGFYPLYQVTSIAEFSIKKTLESASLVFNIPFLWHKYMRKNCLSMPTTCPEIQLSVFLRVYVLFTFPRNGMLLIKYGVGYPCSLRSQ